MDKHIKLHYLFKLEARSSTVNTNQIKSIILLKHSLCPGNRVFAHEKCIIFEILYVYVSKTTKTRH